MKFFGKIFTRGMVEEAAAVKSFLRANGIAHLETPIGSSLAIGIAEADVHLLPLDEESVHPESEHSGRYFPTGIRDCGYSIYRIPELE